MSQLCDQCTQELKDEANFMIHVLNTPNLSDYNVELANEVLYGTLRELYQVEDCEEESTTDGMYTVTTTGGPLTVVNLADILGK